jgi:hypothetical protein
VPGARSPRPYTRAGRRLYSVGASPGKDRQTQRSAGEIRRSTDHYGFAVVMLHPQDFVRSGKRVDPRAVGALKELLSRIQAGEEHKVVKLSQVSGSCEPRP